MIKYIGIYTLLMSVFHTSWGQNQTNAPKDNIKPETKDIVTSQGPNSMVRNIKQARNGDILIASWKGVFRYDGKSFTNLTSKIMSPSFWDVLEDRKGNLWLATRDSGVYYYNARLNDGVGQGKSFQHFTTRDGLTINMVLSIYEDKTGNIWFGACRYDGKSFRNFTTKDGFPRSLIFEDKTGKSWFSTKGGIRIYDGKTFTTLTNKDGKAFKNVWSIIEDKKGNIWLSDNSGLWRYDGNTFTNFTKREVYSILEDKKGNIWISSGIPGDKTATFSRYDAKSLSNKNPTITDIKSGENAFFGILEAHDGSIWFGCLHGVYRYDGNILTDFKDNNKEGHK